MVNDTSSSSDLLKKYDLELKAKKQKLQDCKAAKRMSKGTRLRKQAYREILNGGFVKSNNLCMGYTEEFNKENEDIWLYGLDKDEDDDFQQSIDNTQPVAVESNEELSEQNVIVSLETSMKDEDESVNNVLDTSLSESSDSYGFVEGALPSDPKMKSRSERYQIDDDDDVEESITLSFMAQSNLDREKTCIAWQSRLTGKQAMAEELEDLESSESEEEEEEIPEPEEEMSESEEESEQEEEEDSVIEVIESMEEEIPEAEDTSQSEDEDEPFDIKDIIANGLDVKIDGPAKPEIAFTKEIPNISVVLPVSKDEESPYDEETQQEPESTWLESCSVFEFLCF